MNRYFVYIFPIVLFFSFSSIKAQNNTNDNKTVTLVVSGTGPNIEDARNNALRDALEQAFGAFVSSDTRIVNDELVKDEIISMASGNIEKYSEITCIKLSDGTYETTIQATVSIGKLISFAKAKGSACEFAGATFAMNMKAKELNRQNELKIVSHLREQIALISSEVFGFSIMAKDPKMFDGGGYEIPLEITVSVNEAANSFFSIITKTLSALSLTRSEIEEYTNSNIPMHQVSLFDHSYDHYGENFKERLYYTYTYVFRNDISKEILEILSMPFNNIKIKVSYTDNDEVIQKIPKENFSVTYRINGVYDAEEKMYPYMSSQETSDICFVRTEFIKFPFFPILQRNISCRTNMVQASDIARTGVGECPLVWWIDDSASPFSNIHFRGTSMTKERANAILQQYLLSPKLSNLYTINYSYKVSETDLNRLTGFSMVGHGPSYINESVDALYSESNYQNDSQIRQITSTYNQNYPVTRNLGNVYDSSSRTRSSAASSSRTSESSSIRGNRTGSSSRSSYSGSGNSSGRFGAGSFGGGGGSRSSGRGHITTYEDLNGNRRK